MGEETGDLEVVVDRDECEANAVCEGILPEVFQVDDDDELHIRNARPPAKWSDKLQQAVDMCPKRALSLKRAEPLSRAEPSKRARS